MSASGEALELTILMRCLNQADSIASCVRKARGYLDSRGLRGEVLVADSGSTDGSQVLAQACGARVISISASGYSVALVGGIRAARGTYLMIADVDYRFIFSALDPFIAKLREGYDLVLDSRVPAGLRSRAMPPLPRYLGNPELTEMGRLFQRNNKLQGELRAFRRESMLSMPLASRGTEFASEMVIRAMARKLRIAEVTSAALYPPEEKIAGQPRATQTPWRRLRFGLLFSPPWLFLYPGCALLLAGIAMLGWLLPYDRSVGAAHLGVSAMVLAGAAALAGLQAIVFHLFSKTYAMHAGLLPQDRLVERLRGALRLEVGFTAGPACTLAGLALAACACFPQTQAIFTPLTSLSALRVLIPGATLATLGLQLMLASGLLAILQLNARGRYRRTRATDPPPPEPASEPLAGRDTLIH